MSDTGEKREDVAGADETGDHAPDAPHESEYATQRTTAPQSPYTTRDVAVGAVVALVGMAVVFGVPLLLA